MKIKSGVVKDTTKYSTGKNGPFWVDSDLIRFINGYVEKIGGWQKDTLYGTDTSNSADYTTESTLTGISRNMLFWRASSDGEDRIAVGTHNHLYIIENAREKFENQMKPENIAFHLYDIFKNLKEIE